jgi:F-type H+/Na+-transporting ATPase subunit alpha
VNDISITDLSSEIRAAIAQLKSSPKIERVGVVTRIGDGIAWIYGLTQCGFSEMIEIEGADGDFVTAFAFNLGEDEIGAVLLGSEVGIKAGATARLTGKVLEVPVGPELVGRVVNPLGQPIDGKGAIETKRTSRVEQKAPGYLLARVCTSPL